MNRIRVSQSPHPRIENRFRSFESLSEYGNVENKISLDQGLQIGYVSDTVCWCRYYCSWAGFEMVVKAR